MQMKKIAGSWQSAEGGWVLVGSVPPICLSMEDVNVVGQGFDWTFCELG
jgi:hypothetical protein